MDTLVRMFELWTWLLFCEILSCQSSEPYLHRLPGLWVSVGV